MKKIVLVSGLMAVLLAGCGNHDQPAQVIQPQAQVAQGQVIQQDPQPQQQVYQQPVQQAPVVMQQPAPVVVQQAAPVVIREHDNSGAALATGMALGMIAGGAGNRTEVVHHYHSAPAAPAPAPVIINKTVVNKTVVQAAPQPQTVVNKTTVINRAPAPTYQRPTYSMTASNAGYKSVMTKTNTNRR